MPAAVQHGAVFRRLHKMCIRDRAKVSVNGTHLEAQMGALLSSVILPHHALEMHLSLIHI